MPTPDAARAAARLAPDDEFAKLAAMYPGALARFHAATRDAERATATWALATLRGSILRTLEAAGRDLMAAVVGDQIVTAGLSPLSPLADDGWRRAVEVETAACPSDLRGPTHADRVEGADGLLGGGVVQEGAGGGL